MLNAGNSNGSLTLYESARDYLTSGFSVIPVRTDTLRPKVAAVGWRKYQHQQPTQDELHQWFIKQGHTGLAIVTGAISRLIVLDFDDLAAFAEFQRLCPDLVETRTIRTRRGLHLWFAVSPDTPIASRKGQGVDLKADGGYVVAPPTIIDGHAYICILDRPPLLLTPSALSRIQAFITAQAALTADVGRKAQEGRFSREIEASVESCRAAQTPFITSSGLMNQYHYQATNGSRNDALFYTSLRARDNGYAMQTIIDLLADCHAKQSPSHPHQPENYRQRYREAIATIHSAYSRPPRRLTEQGRATVKQLPNSVREALFQLKQTYTVRVIEGLRLAGIQPGQTFTTNQALKLLAGQVGKHSIYAAFNAHSSSSEALFSQQIPPLDTPKTLAYADSSLVKDQSKKCILERSKNRKKGLHHRPARVFVMPDNQELCAKLGVKMTQSDPLSEDDLASAKQTRMAAHRELIRRRPGLYPRRWLARRLGVDAETLDTYNREIPIHVRHCFSEKPIFWSNLDDIPLALDIAGAFLEDEKGKRYPAKREIARKLLAKKHTLTYKRQDANFYWFGDLPPQFPQSRIHQQQPATTIRHRPHGIAHNGYTDADLHNRYGPRETLLTSVTQTKPLPFVEPLPPLIFRDESAAQRRLAQRVYKTIQQLSSDPSQHISQANAQRLVETYGVAAVEQGLKKLMWYAQRGRVERPAGFLITTSRLAWRELHHATETSMPAPRFRGSKR